MSPCDRILLRVYGELGPPTLVYLPGLHGDWTLIGPFRQSLAGRVRFVEMTYPRTVTWSLEDYAAAVETALAGQGIVQGWLLGESFGSQIVWPLVARGQFQTQAVILAGGFLRHPLTWGARLTDFMCGAFPAKWLASCLFAYARVVRRRHRRDPALRADLDEFIARRTAPDLQAAKHRLRLVAANDPRPRLTDCHVPVFALSGAFDPVVPWLPVRRHLKTNLRDFQEFVLLWADHNVLSTAPRRAAHQVCRWMLHP